MFPVTPVGASGSVDTVQVTGADAGPVPMAFLATTVNV